MDFITPPVDLVMVTYGQASMCRENIRNIIENTDYSNFTFTVIDNHSLDDTWQEVCKELYRHPNTQGFQSDKNLGYGKGSNIGARLTQNPIIVFLNSDVSVKEGHEDWLTHLVDALLESDDIAVAGPKLVNKDNLLMGTGVVGTNKNRRIRNFNEEDIGQCDKAIDVLSVCGAVLAVKRDIFMMYGGYDPLYHFYFEEEDLCWKLRYDGLRIRYEPQSVMIHDHQGSCKDQQLLSNYAQESRTIFYQRWMQWIESDDTVYGRDE